MSKLSFCALGGLEEVGRNCYVYSSLENNIKEHLIVDLGIGFKDDRLTSIDTFMPEIEYLLKENAKISALVITHCHEDHIGAIAYLIQRLNCPIYTTKLNAYLIEEKLKQVGLEKAIKINIVENFKDYQIGSFKVRWIPISHSIIDNNLLLIKTKKGNLVHSGDFKIKLSDKENIRILKDLAQEDITYLFCDSTNSLVAGKSEEEKDIKKDIAKLIENSKGKTWITLFASNLEKLQIISKIAISQRKKIVLMGRSLATYVATGVKFNYLDANVFISEEEAKELEDKQIINLVTGSQGEARSSLYNILITGNSKRRISSNDTVIFSSKVIPGNENKLIRYYNTLSLQNINFFTEKDYKVHVSGHGKQEDLKLLFSYIRPKWVIPIHGEVMHLKGTATLAKSLGYLSESFLCGEEVELFNEDISILQQNEVGKLVYEGSRVISFQEDFIRERTKIFYDGVVFVSIHLDDSNNIISFNIDIIGLLTDNEILEYKEIIYSNITEYVKYTQDSKEDIKENIRIIVRKYFKMKLYKKPIVKIHIL